MPWFGGILDFYINKVVFTITGANFKPCLSIDNVVFKKIYIGCFFLIPPRTIASIKNGTLNFCQF
jgi:hypothetical protein